MISMTFDMVTNRTIFGNSIINVTGTTEYIYDFVDEQRCDGDEKIFLKSIEEEKKNISYSICAELKLNCRNSNQC